MSSKSNARRGICGAVFSHLPGTAKSDLDWCWILTNRNKRSLALDLEKPEGRDALLHLVKSADVFVTNYQSLLLKKFRITWDDLAPAQRSPRLCASDRLWRHAATMLTSPPSMRSHTGRVPASS